MRVWYDACTGKHVRYGVAIAKRLRDRGHEVVLTMRRHPDTLAMARFLKEKFVVAGSYNPESLLTRLEEGTKRQLQFCKLFEKNLPNIAISHGSVDQCRVAFGLGIPIVTTTDTPYAEAVNRLTLPLADYVVSSKAIPASKLQAYSTRGKLMQFDGVDEVAWIKGFRPKVKYDFGRPLIVIRQAEEKAAYTKKSIDLLALAKKLTRLGTVVFLSRYNRDAAKGLTVPRGFVDSASLMAQTDLFIGVGGTITREAALQGTPAMVVKLFKEQYVNEFLAERGFPIFETEAPDAFTLAERIMGQRRTVDHLLTELEDPVDIVADIVAGISKC
jgi:predicted glycosyltransferase